MVQKIHFITFGNERFKNSKKRICKEAKRSGWFDSITEYSPENINHDFKNKHQNILCQHQGAGFWIWKYDIIKQKLNQINDNDIIIYLDAGCTINIKAKKRFDEYINLLNNNQEGIISFQMCTDPVPEYKWTINEIFDFFEIKKNSDIYNSNQYMGTVLIMKKNDHLQLILDKCNEILNHNNLVITNQFVEKNKLENNLFKDNRHDQSILSVVRKKYGSVVLPDETIWIKNGRAIFNNDKAKISPFWATRIKR